MYLYFVRLSACLFVVSFSIILAFGLYANAGLSFGAFSYLFIASLSQAAIFSLPLILLYQLSKLTKHFSWAVSLWIGGSIAYTALFILIIISNYKLYSMYGYFVNGFVLNILLTPGGREAMGISRSSYISAFILMLLIVGFVLAWIRWLGFEKLSNVIKQYKISTTLLFVFLIITQTFVYAYADYKNITPLLDVSDKVVWHVRATMKSAFKEMGIKGTERSRMKVASGKLNYPKSSFNSLKIKQPYNIVWLACESWRADMVDKKIMPNVYEFGEESTRFLNHYSSGNGTRMGLFGQFYGLYGLYWFDILKARRGPVLFDVLMENGYEKRAFTSAKFTYPEFDKTLFSQFSQDELQAFSEGEGWERDKKNVTDLISFMESAQDPFFSFMFFESDHANYYFPKEEAVEENYLEDFDYLVTDMPSNIVAIKNRYINASHYLDSQLGRVIDYVKKSGKMENTIIIITGDHGEEFLEKGRWGHNSTFSQEQIRVPLIIHHPAKKIGPIESMTSHLDLPATVLAALGIHDDSKQYSFGHDLYADEGPRESLVVSDWNGSALITPEAKYNLSVKASSQANRLMTLDDQALVGEVSSSTAQLFSEYIKSTGEFYLK